MDKHAHPTTVLHSQSCPRICLWTAGRFLSVSCPGETSYKTQAEQSQSTSLASVVMAPVSGQGGELEGAQRLDEQNSHLDRWPPPSTAVLETDSRTLLQTRISASGAPCSCTSLLPQLRRTPRAIMRSSRRLLSRSPRGLMYTNSSGARAFSSCS